MEQKMILIKNIEVEVVSNDYVYEMYEKMGNPYVSYNERDHLEKELKMTKELIRGERFINNRGETVCIGMTKQVQDTIGLSFQAFERLHRYNKELREHLQNVRKQEKTAVNKIEHSGFLTRLKYLFTKQLN